MWWLIGGYAVGGVIMGIRPVRACISLPEHAAWMFLWPLALAAVLVIGFARLCVNVWEDS